MILKSRIFNFLPIFNNSLKIYSFYLKTSNYFLSSLIAFRILRWAIKKIISKPLYSIARVLSYCFVLKLKYISTTDISTKSNLSHNCIILFNHILYKKTFKLTFAVAANNGNKRRELGFLFHFRAVHVLVCIASCAWFTEICSSHLSHANR